MVDGGAPVGDDADGRGVFALGDTLLEQIVKFVRCAAAKVIAGANDDAVECVARDLSKFANVVVPAVAGAV